MDCELRPLNALVWREDLYPRSNPDPQTIQRYAADLDVLPPVEVNQHNEIIDGYHGWISPRESAEWAALKNDGFSGSGTPYAVIDQTCLLPWTHFEQSLKGALLKHSTS